MNAAVLYRRAFDKPKTEMVAPLQTSETTQNSSLRAVSKKET